MPYDDPDMTDPLTLHGVAFETTDDAAVRSMAECFVEEYARLGFGRERILQMFRVVGYAGPAMALRVLGAAAIEEIVEDSLARYGDRWGRSGVTRVETGAISLPVLESL